MKAEGPKRKIFDAVDLLTGEEDRTDGGIRMLPVDSIKPFRDHPFRLYEGERLSDMVESVKEHGILNPVLVRRIGDGYEMLSGHNRQNAARISGLKEIPAVVKEDLTDEEALVYVIETNLIQRSFTDMLPSEKAAVLAERYEKICGTKKRDEIIEELEKLEAGGHDVHHAAKSREVIGTEYGMTGRNIARYVRCNSLVEELKELLDRSKISLVTAVDLSYLSGAEQTWVGRIAVKKGWKVTPEAAGALRRASGTLISSNEVEEILRPKKKSGGHDVHRVRIGEAAYQKYFSNVTENVASEIIERALEMYFKEGQDD